MRCFPIRTKAGWGWIWRKPSSWVPATSEELRDIIAEMDEEEATFLPMGRCAVYGAAGADPADAGRSRSSEQTGQSPIMAMNRQCPATARRRASHCRGVIRWGAIGAVAISATGPATLWQVLNRPGPNGVGWGKRTIFTEAGTADEFPILQRLRTAGNRRRPTAIRPLLRTLPSLGMEAALRWAALVVRRFERFPVMMALSQRNVLLTWAARPTLPREPSVSTARGLPGRFRGCRGRGAGRGPRGPAAGGPRRRRSPPLARRASRRESPS